MNLNSYMMHVAKNLNFSYDMLRNDCIVMPVNRNLVRKPLDPSSRNQSLLNVYLEIISIDFIISCTVKGLNEVIERCRIV